MAKQFTLEYVGEVTVSDKAISVVKEDGTNCMMDSESSVFMTKLDGDNMATWMTFTQFMGEMSNNKCLRSDALKAFSCWIDMFYVQQELGHEPTVSLDKLLWEKTYEHDGAVTEEEKKGSIAGWHVFSDGSELAIIWSSECCCDIIVPMIGKEIAFMNCETAIIKL